MKSYYFTFGSDHPLGEFVQRVDAVDEDTARRGMFAFYGDKWSFCYSAKVCRERSCRVMEICGYGGYMRLERIIVVPEFGGPYCDDAGGAA